METMRYETMRWNPQDHNGDLVRTADRGGLVPIVDDDRGIIAYGIGHSADRIVTALNMTKNPKTQRVLIEWDTATDDPETDGHAREGDLPPRELDLPYELVWQELDGITEGGTVADHLSDEHGWCVDGWEAIAPDALERATGDTRR